MRRNEVAGHACSAEALSTRGKAPPGSADRNDAGRVYPHDRRSRSRIANEEKRAGIADPAHFAYPTYARATSVRRDNLKSSIAELLGQIEEAKATQDEAEAELLKIETLEVRDKSSDRLAEAVARA